MNYNNDFSNSGSVTTSCTAEPRSDAGPQLDMVLSDCDPRSGSQVVFPTETFAVSPAGRQILRNVTTPSGALHSSAVDICFDFDNMELDAAYDLAWLRSKEQPNESVAREEVRLVDLFSGCGGMTVGVIEAARALGKAVDPVLAVDVDTRALRTYGRNFPSAELVSTSVDKLFDAPLDAKVSSSERNLRKQLGRIHIAVGGPPCQGHSNLNNHTRRQDPKNALYARMARFAQVVGPDHLIIENVPGVKHDHSNVFARTIDALRDLGYAVDSVKLHAEDLGVAQRRHRTVIVASRTAPLHPGYLRALAATFRRSWRSVGWACGDLLDVASEHPIDSFAAASPVTQQRIDWLFENEEWNLPDELRPDCHRTKRHTYKSVYGRLKWDEPAWTVTTGFSVMGQGRFVHPLRRRTLTAHEAARLQHLPDFFQFGEMNRKGYAQMIGNAVPSKLTYVLALALLSS